MQRETEEQAKSRAFLDGMKGRTATDGNGGYGFVSAWREFDRGRAKRADLLSESLPWTRKEAS